MPIYEYQCQKCSAVTEKMQKFSDEPLKTCPQCGGEVEKLLSLTSFSLKGSGWYVTDYKKSSGGSSAPPSSKAASTPMVEGSASTPKSETISTTSIPAASVAEKSKPASST